MVQALESYAWEHADFHTACKHFMQEVQHEVLIDTTSRGVLHYMAWSADAEPVYEYTFPVGKEGLGEVQPTPYGGSDLPPPRGGLPPVIKCLSERDSGCPLMAVAQHIDDSPRFSSAGSELRTLQETYIDWVSNLPTVKHELLEVWGMGFGYNEVAEIVGCDVKTVNHTVSNYSSWLLKRK